MMASTSVASDQLPIAPCQPAASSVNLFAKRPAPAVVLSFKKDQLYAKFGLKTEAAPRPARASLKEKSFTDTGEVPSVRAEFTTRPSRFDKLPGSEASSSMMAPEARFKLLKPIVPRRPPGLRIPPVARLTVPAVAEPAPR